MSKRKAAEERYPGGLKRCSYCGEDKPLAKFSLHSRKYLSPGCVSCRSRKNKERYRSDSAARAAQLAATMNNVCQKQGVPGKLSKHDVLDVLAADRCYWCGHPNDGTIAFNLDHLHPRSEGGENTRQNLVASCQVCNQGRRTMREDEMRQWLNKVLEANRR